MLYKLRTGDILLAENKTLNITNAYMITYHSEDGYGLLCLSCGEQVGYFGLDKEKFKWYITEVLPVKNVIPKEYMTDFINGKFNLKYKYRTHDIKRTTFELGIEVEYED